MANALTVFAQGVGHTANVTPDTVNAVFNELLDRIYGDVPFIDRSLDWWLITGTGWRHVGEGFPGSQDLENWCRFSPKQGGTY